MSCASETRVHLNIYLGQHVGEVDQHASVPLPLAVGHGHDAGHVVLLQTVLLLAEVPHQVAALGVVLGQDVEEERLHVVVERLVIEEEFDEETEVLTVDLVGVAVHLENSAVSLVWLA